MRTTLHIPVFFVLVLHIQQTVAQGVQCYANFNSADGTCSNILGQVSIDDCCMNPSYGYQENGVCKSCRLASWSTWSHWGPCSVTCTEGVRQRKRACYGLGQCHDPKFVGQTQTEPCEDISCCPENGNWSEWGAWQPCEKGVKRRKRTCSNPPAKCGGHCEGSDEEVEDCDTGITCPSWSAWGSWGACAGTCAPEEGSPPEQQRYRMCLSPPPSTVTRCNDCPGSNTDIRQCTGVPFCAVNGNWGAWSAASDCSVTCGVGKQTQHRRCDNPPPTYGGQDCQGENTKTQLCITPKNCPANGQWAEWSEWSLCDPPSTRPITCRNKQGRRRRLRDCVGREYEGALCKGDGVDFERCYDIEGCKAGDDQQIPKAEWSAWTKWSYCKPDCGDNSEQTRKRECRPDISKYTEKNYEILSGKANIQCPATEKTEESKPCQNVPPC
ncbi:properdin-like [Clarias gariepinus]|uniref:properdin-like n=1 Tax=Clarias gariepinus TaxID=13013 RepID=UPI00234DC81D|nr:properdin-like [Clarias gariepinus]